MDNFFLPLADRPPELTDWESPLCVNRDLLIDCIHRLSDGEEVELPIYDFKSGTTGSWFRMQGDRDAVIIVEGIHMLNPLIFDRVRSGDRHLRRARTRIITGDDHIVRPEQIRVARRMIRDYLSAATPGPNGRARRPERDAAAEQYIAPKSPTRASTSTPSTTMSRASSRALSRNPRVLTPSLTILPFIDEHRLTDLFEASTPSHHSKPIASGATHRARVRRRQHFQILKPRKKTRMRSFFLCALYHERFAKNSLFSKLTCLARKKTFPSATLGDVSM